MRIIQKNHRTTDRVLAATEYTIALETTGKEKKIFVNLIGMPGCQSLEAQKSNSSEPTTVFLLTDRSIPLQEAISKTSKGATSR